MSKPMRFSLKHYGQMSCVEHCPEGEYVLHSDYARLKAEVEALKLGSLLTAVDVLAFINLKAEVERLRASSFVTAVPVEEYEKLKAEVERLRKAGDAMVELLVQMDVVMDMDSDHPEVEAWNAAKEGKQP